MNIGGIKAFLGGDESIRPDTKLNRQLQAEGLQQARVGLENSNSGALSTQYAVAYRALGDSLRQNVVVDGKSNPTKDPVPAEEKNSKPLFDFEAIAKNVLNFVGGVIRNSDRNGADDDTLAGLFTQAREGVEKGISLARKDLSGLLNEELDEGISNAGKSIAKGLNELEKEIFAPEQVSNSLSSASATFQESQFLVRTRDGDEVSLSFSASSLFSVGQSNTVSQTIGEGDNALNQDSQTNNYLKYIERFGFSVSVKGSLDEGELKAIGDLVAQISKVADDFFNGNIEQSFAKSLELGFDKEELIGYSLDLSRAQSLSAVKAYEDVKQYSGEEKPALTEPSIKPILQYVDDMLNTIDKSSNQLNANSDYNNIVTEVINRMEDEVKTPDLLAAINRFHQFNSQIIESASSLSTEPKSS